MSNYTNLRFSRSKYIETSREIAILRLDEHEHLIGQPVVVNYYTNSSKTEIDAIFALGIKNGTGRDCYRVVSLGQHTIIWGVVDSLPDISSLIHGESYMYKDSIQGWCQVCSDDGIQRDIKPISAVPTIYLNLEDNSIWVSDSDRKFRKINDVYTKSEIDTIISTIQYSSSQDITQLQADLNEALLASRQATASIEAFRPVVTQATTQVTNMGRELSNYKTSNDKRSEDIEDSVQELNGKLGAVVTIDEDSRETTGTFDNLVISEGAEIDGDPIKTQTYIDGADEALGGRIDSLAESTSARSDGLEERVETNEGDIDDLEEWQSDANSCLLELDLKTLPVTCEMSGGKVAEFTGGDISSTLSWTFKREGQAVTPTTLILRRGASTILTTDATSSSLNVSVSGKGTTVFYLSGTYKDLMQTKNVSPCSQSISLYLPKYMGHSEKEALESGDDIVAMTKQSINGNTSGTYTIEANSDYLWLCFPSEFKEVSKMTAAGFDFSFDPNPVLLDVVVADTNYQYRCYRSLKKLTGTWTINVTQK